MKKAIKKLDGTELMGRRLRLSEVGIEDLGIQISCSLFLIFIMCVLILFQGRGVSGGGRRRSRSRSPRR